MRENPPDENPIRNGTRPKTASVLEGPSQRELHCSDALDPSTKKGPPDIAVTEEPSTRLGLMQPSSETSGTTEVTVSVLGPLELSSPGKLDGLGLTSIAPR